MPRKLQVYEVMGKDKGVVDQGDQYSLKFIYEHNLTRNAYNMCKGSFGGVASSSSLPHEYICVQSMDGMLSVFEYESFSLSCFLPKALIPGPLRYLPKTDSFVTVGSSWELESYKYQVLTTSAKSFERQSTDSSATKQKKILPEFTYNLGESALDIEIVNHSVNGMSACSILVLGERNLYCLTDTGVLRFMRKFDFNPSCFCPYAIINSASANSNPNAGNSINYIIATHSKILLVHEDVRVKWAAQVDHVPVQLAITRLDELNGVIVTISEDGQLRCSCLGTEPALMNPILNDDSSKQFDMQHAESEYRALQAKIKGAIMNTGAVMTTVNKTGLVLTMDVPSRLDQTTALTRVKDSELSDPLDAIPSITCKLTLKSPEPVQNVKVSVSARLPIIAVPDTVCFSVLGSVPIDQDITFYMKTRHIPSSLSVNVCATYCYSVNGVQRIAETRFELPLRLVAKAGQQTSKFDQESADSKGQDSKPTSQASANLKKITLETNKPCVNLTELMPELSGSYIAANGNIVAAQYYGHPNTNITIQAAKSGANRYRIQSENYESLWLIAHEFVRRLKQFFVKQSQDVSITCQEAIPVDEFKLLIDKHLELRQLIDHYNEMLEKNCGQFRAVQKRMLTKLKDKSPSSMDSMEALLDATYRRILSISESYMNTQKELSIASHSLNNMSNLYVLLLSLAFKLNKEDREILENIMSFKLPDTADLGWEETITAAITNLIRGGLSKGKDSQSQPQIQLKLPEDSNKLEKQMKSLVSKFESGATISSAVYMRKDAAYEPAPAPAVVNKPARVAEDDSSARKRAEEEREKAALRLEEQRRKLLAEKSKAPVAAKTRTTFGEDYDEEEDEKPVVATTRASREVAQEPVRRPFGATKLPTFEELMKSTDVDKKGFDSDEEI